MTEHTPTKVAALALSAYAAAYGLYAWIGFGPAAENESPIGEVSRWCERVSDGFMREPINTLGNLGFVAIGLLILNVLSRDDTKSAPAGNRFFGNQSIALLYAGAVIFLGPGSMLMHGSHTFFGAWLDNLSMVTYILIPWLYNLARLARWTMRTFFTVYGTVLGLYAVAFWLFGHDLGIGLDLFGVSIGLWVISEVLYRWWSPAARLWSGLVGFAVAAVFGSSPAEVIGNLGEYWWVILFWLPGLIATSPPTGRRRYTPWFWAGIVSFMVGYAIWLTGTDEHEWCRPDSILQAHAVWHLLTAVATWCFFKFLRTERRLTPSEHEAATAV